MATPDLPWNYDNLSDNDCLTVDMILAFPDKNWDWMLVSSSEGITMSDIESHMDLPWVWGGCNSVSRNTNIRIFDVENHPDKPWDWSNLPSTVFNPDEYIDQWICKYNILSMHDEDYDRGEECLDYKNVVDLVIQNEYCISCISEYI